METGLQLGSDLLQVGSQMMDLTWSNKDPSNKAVSIFETVIIKNAQTLFANLENNLLHLDNILKILRENNYSFYLKRKSYPKFIHYNLIWNLKSELIGKN